MVFERSGYWYSPSFRDAVLACGFAERSVAMSALATFQPGSGVFKQEQLDWLEKWLIPACKKNEKLKKALCGIAWEFAPIEFDEYKSGSGMMARRLLTAENRLESWISPDFRARVIDPYVKEHGYSLIHFEPGISDALLTREEQLDIFFGSPIGGYPSYYEGHNRLKRLFIDNPSKRRLSGKLLRHQSTIELYTWFPWIETYELASFDKRFQTRLAKIAQSNEKGYGQRAMEILAKAV